MKKKLIITCISAIFTFNAMADSQLTLTKEEINNRNKDILAKAGISISEYNEINIVSANTYTDSKGLKQNANDAHVGKKIKEYLAMNEEQQKNGYVKGSEPRARELLDLKHVASYHKKKYEGVLSSESTHIRASGGVNVKSGVWIH